MTDDQPGLASRAIVLMASTVNTSIIRVCPVSRSTAPWMLRRSRPLVCSTARLTSLGAQHSYSGHRDQLIRSIATT